MSDMPAIVKILKYLRKSTAPRTYADIISVVDEGQVYVDGALKKLTAEGIINDKGQHYFYNATAKAEGFCNKLFSLYDTVTRRPQMELLVRGLLCQPISHNLMKLDTLLEVLGKEGFAAGEVNRFVEEESSKGYLKRVKLVFITRESFSPPQFIPPHRLPYLREVSSDEQEQLKEYCNKLDLSLNKVDYVMGSYPAELAEPAIQFLEKDKSYIREKLREDAFQQRRRMRRIWHLGN